MLAELRLMMRVALVPLIACPRSRTKVMDTASMRPQIWNAITATFLTIVRAVRARHVAFCGAAMPAARRCGRIPVHAEDGSLMRARVAAAAVARVELFIRATHASDSTRAGVERSGAHGAGSRFPRARGGRERRRGVDRRARAWPRVACRGGAVGRDGAGGSSRCERAARGHRQTSRHRIADVARIRPRSIAWPISNAIRSMSSS